MTHAGVDMIRSFLEGSKVASGSIDDQRRAMAELAAHAPPPDGVAVEPVGLGGRQAERLVPAGGRSDAAVLYLHGGGYCTGTLDSHRQLAGRIALAAGVVVVTLAYRLAPEHPFPAALDDATAAYRELLGSGLAPERLAVAGDSAGGGLTVATLLALREAGTPLPAAAVCLSPWVDLTQEADTYVTLASVDPMVDRAGLDEMAAAYLGGADARTPLASPLFAEDLSGLPPIMIEVGTDEVLLADATALADRLVAAGSEAHLTVWPEMVHVFQAFPAPLVPEADESVAAVGRFVAAHLA